MSSQIILSGSTLKLNSELELTLSNIIISGLDGRVLSAELLGNPGTNPDGFDSLTLRLFGQSYCRSLAIELDST